MCFNTLIFFFVLIVSTPISLSRASLLSMALKEGIQAARELAPETKLTVAGAVMDTTDIEENIAAAPMAAYKALTSPVGRQDFEKHVEDPRFFIP